MPDDQDAVVQNLVAEWLRPTRVFDWVIAQLPASDQAVRSA
jgi:hypothetical protein